MEEANTSKTKPDELRTRFEKYYFVQQVGAPLNWDCIHRLYGKAGVVRFVGNEYLYYPSDVLPAYSVRDLETIRRFMQSLQDLYLKTGVIKEIETHA